MDSTKTSASLLSKVRRGDEDAWNLFVDRYGPVFLHWCRKWRLQEADKENVWQEVLVKLLKSLATYQYAPETARFRTWLYRVVASVLTDFTRRQKKPGGIASGDSQAWKILKNATAREDLVARFEREFKLELLETVLAEVRAMVTERDWRIYDLTALQGADTQEVAAQEDMKLDNVFKVKSRVGKMVKQKMLQRNEDFHASLSYSERT